MDRLYGLAVDWWAFGVILYQMLLHRSPFEGEDEDEIYDAILGSDPVYPKGMSEDAQVIVSGLLNREPEARLASTRGFEEIRLQTFFRDIDWDALYKKTLTPPFIPQIGTATDVSNFDSELTSGVHVLTSSNVGE